MQYTHIYYVYKNYINNYFKVSTTHIYIHGEYRETYNTRDNNSRTTEQWLERT